MLLPLIHFRTRPPQKLAIPLLLNLPLRQNQEGSQLQVLKLCHHFRLVLERKIAMLVESSHHLQPVNSQAASSRPSNSPSSSLLIHLQRSHLSQLHQQLPPRHRSPAHHNHLHLLNRSHNKCSQQ